MEESINSLFGEFLKDISEEEIMMMPVLKLAFLGDSVFELCIRSLLMKDKRPVKILHREKVEMVNAKNQAEMLNRCLPFLNEEELDFIHRARNVKVNTVPKSSNQKEYRQATALEALIGLLFLKNQNDRILYILEKGWNSESSVVTINSRA